MNLFDILRQTIATLRAHKMRSFLTMFGIIWGIASVILLVGLGLGFSKDQKKRMETLGKDLVIIWGGRTSSQVGGLAAGRQITLNIDDARLIKNEAISSRPSAPNCSAPSRKPASSTPPPARSRAYGRLIRIFVRSSSPKAA